MKHALPALLALALAATPALAASPSLVAVRPPGGQRGTEVEVNFTGARLADAKEVLVYKPGVTTTKLWWSTTDTSRRRSRSPPTPASASATCGSAPPPASASCARSASAR